MRSIYSKDESNMDSTMEFVELPASLRPVQLILKNSLVVCINEAAYTVSILYPSLPLNILPFIAPRLLSTFGHIHPRLLSV